MTSLHCPTLQLGFNMSRKISDSIWVMTHFERDIQKLLMFNHKSALSP